MPIIKRPIPKDSQSLFHHPTSLGIFTSVMHSLLPFKILLFEEKECKALKPFTCLELTMQVSLLRPLLKRSSWKKRVKPDMIWGEKSSLKRFGSSSKPTEMVLKTNWGGLVQVWTGTEKSSPWMSNWANRSLQALLNSSKETLSTEPQD